jgi:hypothetical protein
MKELVIIQIPLDKNNKPIISVEDCGRSIENINKWIDNTRYTIVLAPANKILTKQEYGDLIVVPGLDKYDFYNLLGIRGKWFKFKSKVKEYIFKIKFAYWKLKRE